jgi:hypothetical protein
MDISKLPKLSQSDAPPPVSPPPTPVDPTGARSIQFAPPSRVAEAWISIAIGAILLLCYPRTLEFFSSRIFHTAFNDDFLDTDGSKILYRNTIFFWSDLAITAFAVVLIFDGILMVRARHHAVVLAALCLTILATLGNLIYLVMTFSSGVPIISALAVAFGVYIAISQWSAFRLLSTASRQVK